VTCSSATIARGRNCRNPGTDTARDLPAYANGSMRRHRGDAPRTVFADPDAAWGRRSATSNRTAGSFYGFKIHAAVDVATELPLAWIIRPANEHDSPQLEVLLDALALRVIHPDSLVLDKGYDYDATYELCMDRGCLPIIALRMTQDVLQDPYGMPECEHGLWVFAGAERARRRTKWRCPTGECRPKSRWLRANRRRPLVPRKTKRWYELYNDRGAIEREFARLKHERGLVPLRVRGLPRVALHADLCIFARLVEALLRARAGPANRLSA
jgi:IS5 family transposase